MIAPFQSRVRLEALEIVIPPENVLFVFAKFGVNWPPAMTRATLCPAPPSSISVVNDELKLLIVSVPVPTTEFVIFAVGAPAAREATVAFNPFMSNAPVLLTVRAVAAGKADALPTRSVPALIVVAPE